MLRPRRDSQKSAVHPAGKPGTRGLTLPCSLRHKKQRGGAVGYSRLEVGLVAKASESNATVRFRPLNFSVWGNKIMFRTTYEQRREELLQRIDVDEKEFAGLAGGTGTVCPDGDTECLQNETCCWTAHFGMWACFPEPNAVCCDNGRQAWACPAGAMCVYTEGSNRGGCRLPGGGTVFF